MADNVIVRVPEQQFIRGEDGYSPEVTIEDIAHGHSVNITDREHPEGQSFDVLDGASAYEQAVAGGYTGTEAQFNEDLTNFKTLHDETEEVAPFYAEYGVTTKAEIAAAINGKRQIYAYQSLSPYSPILPYVGKIHYADEHSSGTGYRFALTEGRYLTIFELTSSWNYRSVDLEAPAQRAEAAADQALNRMNSADQSAQSAAGSASNASRDAGTASTAATTATAKAGEASDSATAADDSAKDAEAYAIGKRGGTDVGSTDSAYHNNAKYYAEQAASSASDAVTAKGAAETAQGKAEDAQEAAEAVLESIPADYTELTEDVDDLKSAVGQWYYERYWPSARYPFIQIENAPSKVYYKLINPSNSTGVDIYASNDGFVTQTRIYSTTETEFTAELNTQGYSALRFSNILPASQTDVTVGAIIHGFDDHSLSQEVLDQKSDIEDINDLLSKHPVNVYSYGALGLGLNYTNEIAAAIAACPNNGVVYFPAGTYIVNDMALKSNMTIIGEGKATIIKLADNQPEGSNCCAINDVHDVTVRNISFDGNRLNEHATGHAHDYGFNGVHIRNAYNVILDTVYSYNNGYHGCIVTNSHDVTIQNGEFHDNGYRPIHGHSTVEGVTVEGNICFNNGLGMDEGSGTVSAGFDGVFFFDNVHELLIANNYIYDVNTEAGIQLGGDVLGTGDVSDGIVVCGNIIKTKGSAIGIRLLGKGIRDVTITGNAIENCDVGIYFYDVSSTADDANRDIIVSSNIIRCGGSIGIRFLNYYSNITIIGNTIVDGSTAGINFAGQHDIIVQSNIIEDFKNGVVVNASQNLSIANNIIRAVKTGSPMSAAVLAFDTSSKVYVLYNFCSHRIGNAAADGITLP